MANQKTLAVGDTVWHLSGGPKMVVITVYQNGKVECRYWHEDKKFFQHDDFLIAELTDKAPEV